MSKSFTLAALAAAAISAAALLPAEAQGQVATYCRDRIVARSFYSTSIYITETQSLVVSYYVQLDTVMANHGLQYQIFFDARRTVYPLITEAQNGWPVRTVGSSPDNHILLGKQIILPRRGHERLNTTQLQRLTKVGCSNWNS